MRPMCLVSVDPPPGDGADHAGSPRDIVDQIDGFRTQRGFRTRRVIVAQLIREMLPKAQAATNHEESANAA